MKKWLCLCLTVLVFGLMCLPALAAEECLIDEAQLLSEKEAQTLETQLQQVSEKHDIDIVVLTVDSLYSRSAEAYAEDYYKDHGYGEDGVLLLVCMAEREWYVSTAGKCISRMPVEAFEEALIEKLSAGEYYDAFSGFTETCHRQMVKRKVLTVLGGFGIGAVIGLIVVLVMKSQMKSVRSQAGADSYVEGGDLQLTHRSDIFLYQTVTRRARPQNNGSGGFRSGSSGRSHGGGGGRF